MTVPGLAWTPSFSVTPKINILCWINSTIRYCFSWWKIVQLQPPAMLSSFKSTMRRYISKSSFRSLNVASRPSDLVGNTPLMDLSQLISQKNVRLLGKLESLGPCSSVKDRIGKYMIDDAEERGLITPGKSVLVEPTSGKCKGYPLHGYQSTNKTNIYRKYWYCASFYCSRTWVSMRPNYA